MDITPFIKMIFDVFVMILNISFTIAGYSISFGSILACFVLMAVLIYALSC